jgi:hypothetical protein
VTGQSIVKALKLAGPIVDATTTPNPSGRVGKLSLVTPLTSLQVPATQLRGAIGLRSTWFTLGVMSLAPPVPNPPLPYGSQVTLSSTIRGVSGAALEQRTSGSTWQTVGPVSPGAVKLTQKPAITTDYRLATPAAAAAYVRIRVAPLVQVSSFTTTLVAGTVQPVLPAAPVEVQQQNADLTTWTVVATGAVAADGSFSVPVQLIAGGTYRVSVAPGAGYAPGVGTSQVVVR